MKERIQGLNRGLGRLLLLAFGLLLLAGPNNAVAAATLSQTTFDANTVSFNLTIDNVSTSFPDVRLTMFYDADDDGVCEMASEPALTGGLTENMDLVYDNSLGQNHTQWFGPDTDPALGRMVTNLTFNGFFNPGRYCVFGDYTNSSNGVVFGLIASPFIVNTVPGAREVSGELFDMFDWGTPLDPSFVAVGEEVEGQNVLLGFAFSDPVDGYFAVQLAEGTNPSGFLTVTPFSTSSYYVPRKQLVNIPAVGLNAQLLEVETSDGIINGSVIDDLGATVSGEIAVIAETPFGYFGEKFFNAGTGYNSLYTVSGMNWLVKLKKETFPAGYFSSRCNNPGDSSLDGCTVIPATGGVPANFILFKTTSHIAVTVVNEDGNLAEGVLAAATRINAAGTIQDGVGSHAFSDNLGRASLSVNNGDWQVSLCTSCHVNKVLNDGVYLVPGVAKETTTSGATVNLQMDTYYADGALQGYVYDTDGNPVYGARINAQTYDAINNGQPIPDVDTKGIFASTESDATGHYFLPLLGGNWTVTAQNQLTKATSAEVSFFLPVDNNDRIDQYNEIKNLFLILPVGAPAYNSALITAATGSSVEWNQADYDYVVGGDYAKVNGLYYKILSVGPSRPGYLLAYLQNVDQISGVAIGAASTTGMLGKRIYFQGTTFIPTGLLDRDNDGMPDNYEIWNGLNPFIDDAALDPDGDGFTNFQEFAMGTDPQVENTPSSLSLSVTPTIDASGTALITLGGIESYGGALFQIFHDLDADGVVDSNEWPILSEYVIDNGGVWASADFAADANLATGTIETSIGHEPRWGNLAPGSYVIRATDRYSQSVLAPLVVTAVGSPTGTISGRLEKAGVPGLGIANAMVAFGHEQNTGDFHVVSFAFTDTAGYYTIEVSEALPVTGSLTALRNDGVYLSSGSTEFTLQQGQPATQNLTLKQGDAVVSGQVVSRRDMRPGSFVPIYAEGWSPTLGGFSSEALTDLEGNYTLPVSNSVSQWQIELQPSPLFYAYKDNFLESQWGDSVTTSPSGGPYVLKFWSFPVTTYIGTSVVDEYGSAVSGIGVGASLFGHPDAAYDGIWAEARSNVAGNVRIGVTEGDWNVGLFMDSVLPQVGGVSYEMVPGPWQTASDVADGVDSALPGFIAYYADGAIEGQVRDLGDNPIQGATVSASTSNAYNVSASAAVPGTLNPTVQTGSDGRFRIPVIDGDWVVQVSSGEQMALSHPIMVETNGDHNPLEVIDTGIFYLQAAHCFNAIMDFDEEIIDGGGTECSPTSDLTIVLNGTGIGIVQSQDLKIDTAAAKSTATYKATDVVILVATRDTESIFVGWSGDAASCGTNTTCVISTDASKTATATFNYAMHPLTVSVVGIGQVTSNDLYIDTDLSQNSWTYYQGTAVVLTATTTEPRTVFSGWDDCTGIDNVCALNVNAPTNVTANFTYIGYPPELTLVGDAVFYHEVKTPYIDAGAQATDVEDDNATLTSNIVVTNPIDINRIATYFVEYNVTDSHGNLATPITREVRVVDRTAPVITLLGEPEITLNVFGPAYVDAGATAMDNYDGDRTSAISLTGSVNMSVVGNYELSYNVIDTANNSALTVKRMVHVVDRVPPVITVTERVPGQGTTEILEVKSPIYNDPGATATDNYDIGPVAVSTDSSALDLNAVGDYTINYSATDVSLNTGTATRTVSIVDTTPPVTTDNAPTVWVNTDVTVTLDPVDAGTSVANTYYCSDTAPGCTPATPGTIINLTPASGTVVTYYISYYSIDIYNNVEDTVVDVPVRIDKAVPNTSNTSVVGWHADNQEFELNVDIDNGSQMTTYWCLDNTGTTCTTMTQYNSTDKVDVPQGAGSDQAWYVRYYSTDAAGNVEAPYKSQLVQIDKKAPVTAVENVPAQEWVNTPVTLTLAPTDTGVNAGDSASITTTWCSATGLGSSCNPRVGGTPSKSVLLDTATVEIFNVYYYSVDTLLNEESVAGPVTVKIDKIKPVTISDAPTGWVKIDTTVHFTPSDADSTMIGGEAKTQYCVDSDNICDPNVTGTEISLTTDGLHYVRYRSTDNAGNIEMTQSALVKLDKTDPVINVTEPAPGAGTTVYLEVNSASYSDLGATALDNLSGDLTTSIIANTSQVDSNLSKLGSYTVSYTVTDLAGNTGTAQRTVIIGDFTSPTGSIAIDESVSAPINYSAINLSLSCTDQANASGCSEMMIANDSNFTGATWETIAPSKPWSLVPTNGSNIVYLKYRDTALNESGIYSASIDYDKIDPIITVTELVQGEGTTVNIEVNSVGYTDPGATALDNYSGDLTSVIAVDTSAVDNNLTAMGEYTVSYTVDDAAGNTGTAQRTVIIGDRTAPTGTISIDEANVAPIKFTGITLTLSCTDQVNASGCFEMMIANDSNFTGATWETIAPSKPWSLVPINGSNVVYIKYRDTALNESGAYTASIIYDGIAPAGASSITIVDDANGYTTTATVNLALVCDDGSGSGCKQMRLSNDGVFDNEVWVDFTGSVPDYPHSGVAGPGLKVYVQYMDNAGNETEGEISDSTYYDPTLPTGSIDINSGAEITTSNMVSLFIQCSDTGSGCKDYRVANALTDINSVGWSAWPLGQSSITVPDWVLSVPQDFEVISVEFKDAAGNVIATPATDTIDYVPSFLAPASITVPATDDDGTYQVTWVKTPTVTGGVTYTLQYSTDPTFQLNVTAVTGKTDPNLFFNVANAPAGVIYYRVRAEKGNLLSPWAYTTAPTNHGCVVLDLDGDGTPDGLDSDIDGDGLPNTWETNYGLDPRSAAGINGAAGDPDNDLLTNLQEFTNGTNPIIENLPPTATINAPAAGWGTVVSPTISWEESGTGSAITSANLYVNSNGGGYTLYANQINGQPIVTPLGQGSHDLKIVLMDAAGNPGESAVVTVGVDTIAPVVSMKINDAVTSKIATRNELVTLYLTCDPLGGSPCDQMRFSNDGVFDSAPEDWQVGADTADWNLLAGEGSKTVWAEGKDQAGNIHQVTANIVLDQTDPVISLTGANPQNIFLNDPYSELGATAVDVDPDINAKITIDISNVDTSVVGDYIVSYEVVDWAGNTSQTVTRAVHVFNQAQPPTGFIVPASSTTGAFTLRWTASADAESYQIEESTTGAFTGVATYTVPSGATATYDVTGRTPGTYYYQIRSTHSVMTPSNWIVGVRGCVVTIPASMVTPVSGGTLAGSTQNFIWEDVGATSYYLQIGTSTVGSSELFAGYVYTNSKQVAGLPTNGVKIYVRLWSVFGSTWASKDFTYTAAMVPASMSSPINGVNFSGTSQTFSWNYAGATSYYLQVGSTLGAQDIGGGSTVSTSKLISGLPTDGRSVYVRLWTVFGSTWIKQDYIYTSLAKAEMISPVNGSAFIATSKTFTWNDAAATSYYLQVGSSVGTADIASGYASTPSKTVYGLPTDGRTIYVRLWTVFGSVWASNDYSYTALAPSDMIGPVDGTTFSSTSQTFTWTNSGATSYYMQVGTVLGGQDIGKGATTVTNKLISGLPIDGSQVYVRLWSVFGSTWTFRDYAYKALAPAIISSPVDGTTLSGASQNFIWEDAGATSYFLQVGTSVGASNLGSGSTAATMLNISGLPTDGSVIYVRLWSVFGPTWISKDYSYTSGP